MQESQEHLSSLLEKLSESLKPVLNSPSEEPVLQEKAERSELRKDCQNSLYFLARAVLELEGLTPDTHATACEFLTRWQSPSKMLVAVPGFRFETILTVALPIWTFIQALYSQSWTSSQTQVHLLVVGDTTRDCAETLRDIGRLLQSPLFSFIFPELKAEPGDCGQHRIWIRREVEREEDAVEVSLDLRVEVVPYSQTPGKRQFDGIIMNLSDVAQPGLDFYRKCTRWLGDPATARWWTLSGRSAPRDIVYQVEQAYPDTEIFTVPSLRKDGTAIYPESFPAENLEKIRNTVGERLFSTNFLLDPPVDTDIVMPVIDERALEWVEKYKDNPVKCVEEVFGAKPYLWQGEALEALADPSIQRIAILSRPECGKTALAAWTLLWWLPTRPWCKIPCTAPSEHQLKDILWAEVARWIRLGGMDWMYDHRASQLTLAAEGMKKEWFAVPVVGQVQSGQSTTTGLQGLHGENLLFIVDEGGGLPEGSWGAIDNAFTRNATAKLLAIGNPTELLGTRFHKIFTTLRERYWTIQLDEFSEPVPSQDFKDLIESTYGKDSAMWEIKIQGKYPTKVSGRVLISEDDVVKCEENEIQPTGAVILGVDPARYGKNRTTIVTRHGGCILSVKESQGDSLMVTVGTILQICQTLFDAETPVEEIRIDEIGVGGGIVDRLREVQDEPGHENADALARVEVMGINVSRKPTHLKLKMGKAQALRDELWMSTAQIMRRGDVDFSRVKGMFGLELQAATWNPTTKGAIVIKPKALGTWAAGVDSPDRADGLNLALHPGPYNSGGIRSFEEAVDEGCARQTGETDDNTVTVITEELILLEPVITLFGEAA